MNGERARARRDNVGERELRIERQKSRRRNAVGGGRGIAKISCYRREILDLHRADFARCGFQAVKSAGTSAAAIVSVQVVRPPIRIESAPMEMPRISSMPGRWPRAARGGERSPSAGKKSGPAGKNGAARRGQGLNGFMQCSRPEIEAHADRPQYGANSSPGQAGRAIHCRPMKCICEGRGEATSTASSEGAESRLFRARAAQEFRR